MVSPVTNCSPIRRMAMSTPLRIIGSPLLPMMRLSEEVRPDSLWVETSLPVSSRPQVAALTNSDGLLPRCGCQLPVLILSRIRASRVPLSGMRSSASARHISATPSWDDRENSCSRPWTMPARPPALFWLRSFSAMPAASLLVASAMAAGRRACSSSIGTTSGSGRR
ncbi:hypothetical protein D3C80_1030310 [compost metagenome]